jgi:hypothetical protein
MPSGLRNLPAAEPCFLSGYSCIHPFAAKYGIGSLAASPAPIISGVIAASPAIPVIGVTPAVSVIMRGGRGGDARTHQAECGAGEHRARGIVAVTIAAGVIRGLMMLSRCSSRCRMNFCRSWQGVKRAIRRGLANSAVHRLSQIPNRKRPFPKASATSEKRYKQTSIRLSLPRFGFAWSVLFDMHQITTICAALTQTTALNRHDASG